MMTTSQKPISLTDLDPHPEHQADVIVMRDMADCFQRIQLYVEHRALLLWIPGNTPSQKNSVSRYGVKSKTFQRWFKYLDKELEAPKTQGNIARFRYLASKLGCRWNAHFQFVRDSRRRFDYINAAQAPLDWMVKQQMLKDDDYANVVPSFSPYVLLDKEYPGCTIIFRPIEHREDKLESGCPFTTAGRILL